MAGHSGLALSLWEGGPGPPEENKMPCKDGSLDNVRINIPTISTDVINKDKVGQIVDLVVAHFVRVDFLFNNMGINIMPSLVEDTDSADFIRVINTKVTTC
jgi:NAD(P)-dependent dehydrogenase (short-subunit alcohol dehydrogenase family)